MISEPIVRPLAKADKQDVCRIWVAGLAQSRLAAPWYLRRFFMGKMNLMRDAALADTGDVGPQGANLLATYDAKDDRRMFVATIGQPETVVGCCAVKKGMSETKREDDSTVGSIWRMSVDPVSRGHGIATKLMDACEGWARQNGCKKMGLFTINPVAAKFYVDRMGYKAVDHFHMKDNAIAKRLIKPVFRYEKRIA